MNRLVCVVVVAALSVLAAAPVRADLPFELTTLNGARHTGEIVRLSSDRAVLKTGKSEVAVPIAEVLDLRSVRTRSSATLDPRKSDVTLADKTRLFWSALRGKGDQVVVESAPLGTFEIPLRSVSTIRFQPLDPVIADGWKDLCGRTLTHDMLVIRKGNVLDHLDGTAGSISEKTIRFVIDREEVPVKREKVFGVIYARRNADPGKPVCEISVAGGDVVQAQSSEWMDGKLSIGLLGGAKIAVSGDEIVSLDYSLGKVRYLSDLEPRQVKYESSFGSETDYFLLEYHRDRPRDGKSLRVGNKEYARGLWIHPRTWLKYRLNGDYRRFQAVMGMDQNVDPNGHVQVVISGDGKTLHESAVRGTDAPQSLDLDVSGVRDLEIFVDYRKDKIDICNHLDLADAKVIK